MSRLNSTNPSATSGAASPKNIGVMNATTASRAVQGTSGMIMTAVDILKNIPHPTEADVRHGLEGNVCRCTGYHNIVKSVLAAADAMGGT